MRKAVAIQVIKQKTNITLFTCATVM